MKINKTRFIITKGFEQVAQVFFYNISAQMLLSLEYAVSNILNHKHILEIRVGTDEEMTTSIIIYCKDTEKFNYNYRKLERKCLEKFGVMPFISLKDKSQLKYDTYSSYPIYAERV